MTSIWKKSLVALSAGVFIISAYFIAGVLLFANALYNGVNARDMEEAVKTLGVTVPPALFGEEGTAAEWISRFGNEGPHRITLIGRNGKVIADTGGDSSLMESHLDRPEFQAALVQGSGRARRQSVTMGQEYIYTAVGIKNPDGEIAGVLRLSRLVPSFSGRIYHSAFPFLFCGFLLILGCCSLLYGLSRSFSHTAELKLDAELMEKTRELKERAEEAGAEVRRREAIFNSMSEGVIALDGELRIILVNPRIRSLFGVAAGKDVQGMTLLEFSHSADLEETARQALDSGRTGETAIRRYIWGVEQRLQVFAAPLDEGRGAVMVLADITRLVKLEQVRKDFAANVSHELRTPIQIIKGFTENLLDSSLDDKEQIRHFAEIIGKNTQTMENLTNDLLTLVSLEDENSFRPPQEEILLAPLIAEAAGMVEFARAKKCAVIEIDCPKDLRAKLYSPFIVQALVNLMDNGIKYSDSGSRLWVRAFPEGEVLVIEVKDKGIGIPAEHLDRIFERFYRVARSREDGGTGLGLAIVRHIALLHGGSAVAESHAGEGSLFRLRLPLG